jgi:hypothetical protein
MRALFFSPITWDQHLVWMIPAALVVVAAAARVRGSLTAAGYVMLALYIVLTMVLNYEVVGRANWEALKSFHHLGIAMLMLFGLLLASAGPRTRIQSPLGQTNPGTPGMAGGS